MSGAGVQLKALGAACAAAALLLSPSAQADPAPAADGLPLTTVRVERPGCADSSIVSGPGHIVVVEGSFELGASTGPVMQLWLWLESDGRTAIKSGNQLLGTDLTLHNLSELRLSPDGRHLAALSSGEGHPMLHVFDVRKLVCDGDAKPVQEINPHPSTALELKGWKGGRLHFRSGLPTPRTLSHARALVGGGDMALADMLEDDAGCGLLFDPASGRTEWAKGEAARFGRRVLARLPGADDTSALVIAGVVAGLDGVAPTQALRDRIGRVKDAAARTKALDLLGRQR